ncbi:MAG: MogA/MoaB family molybdenum cofactor biosynthesis protein [Chloroflexi bacterium]|nr:MogA/MoaB family molybdenum cofactor biosynthesis protein [Chloroflexota bacterium]
MRDRPTGGKARAAAVTVSDKGHAGEREDRSGPILAEELGALGIEVAHTAVVPDEQGRIEVLLRDLCDRVGLDLVITTGGTGPAPRDVTPEATRAVIQREMPGLAELLRIEGLKKTPLAVLSRGIAGIRGRTLIINLPGSPKAVREGMEALRPVLPHALQMLRGESLEHGPTGSDSD